MTTAHPTGRLTLALLMLAVAATAGAQTGKAPAARTAWMTVGDTTLETMRGGFDLGGGLMVSFGISRAITVNGVLLAATTFNVPDIARITPVQAAALERQMNSVNLVQVGPNNSVASATSLPTAATVVQNTLDNQTIQTRTLIDATTNAMSLAKSINAAGVLRDALIRGR
ncbi:hypothetical protein [Variovorax sp. LT1R16]|uniref:hypothetical protein n=1 Tax=Variovorax sp. LT1R16 TaxID=3443728 RepID=UPI003F47798D